MDWEELYPVVASQAYYAVLRYDPRRKDKVQELVCQSYEKYRTDIGKGKEIKKQEFKCFITQRAKEVDLRSVCKKGLGGTSATDALSFYRRRPDSGTEIVEFSEWMSSNPLKKDSVEESISFRIDFSNWQLTLPKIERRILSMLLKGYTATKIADKIKLNYVTVRETIKKMRTAFISYFQLTINKPLTAF
jgi:hypothetical protein